MQLISAFPSIARAQATTVSGSAAHHGGDVKTLSKMAAPGLYPGQVVEARNPAMCNNGARDAAAISSTLEKGMKELTGATDAVEAWKHFFEPGDVVGIKVNPVGRKPLPGEGGRNPRSIGSISSPEVLVKVVRCLREAGIPAKDIIVFERYANEFCDAGYKNLVERELPGVFSDQQPVFALQSVMVEPFPPLFHRVRHDVERDRRVDDVVVVDLVDRRQVGERREANGGSFHGGRS